MGVISTVLIAARTRMGSYALAPYADELYGRFKARPESRSQKFFHDSLGIPACLPCHGPLLNICPAI